MDINFINLQKTATKRTAAKTWDTVTISKKTKTEPSTSYNLQVEWSAYEIVAESQCIDDHVAKSTAELFEQGNTIPFMARYRKHITGNMEAEQLRDFKELYDKAIALRDKICSTIRNVVKQSGGKINPVIQKRFLNAKSLEELELLVSFNAL